MAIFKCKMCGGTLQLTGNSVAVCDYCGTKQTVPGTDDEKKLTLFGRANRLRAACEYDKAAGIYESIVEDFPEESEAYWGLVLCKYGIEYVDDPATGKKIPTCHRSSFDSVMEDSDFEQALENADSEARLVYREEAKQIEELRRGIIEVSSKEEPFDIFICYKETDEKGERTIDSLIAQDVYDALCEKGYRVFFSRITLEDKLGQEYEPYIFAALNSAKVMLAFGTDYEYYNAVWVKNEWSRFLQLIAAGQKKTLIPCYKDIDAYDMPKEFAKLQAQDMGKVGAIQDLLRGIEKIIPKNKNTVVVNDAAVDYVIGKVSDNDPAFIRAQEFLNESKWTEADACYERILDRDPHCAKAYLGKLLSMLKIADIEQLVQVNIHMFLENDNYVKAKRYASEDLCNLLIEHETENIYQQLITKYDQLESNYPNIQIDNDSEEKKIISAYEDIMKQFLEIKSYKNVQLLLTALNEKIKQITYDSAISQFNLVSASSDSTLYDDVTISHIEKCIEKLNSISDFQDSSTLATAWTNLCGDLKQKKKRASRFKEILCSIIILTISVFLIAYFFYVGLNM